MVRASSAETNPEGVHGIDRDCDCHFLIEDVALDEGEYGQSVKTTLVVCASSVPEMVGRKHSEFFAVDGKAASRFWSLCVAAGIISRDFWRDCKAKGADAEIDESLLKARQFCGGIRMENYGGKKEEHKGKKFPKLGFRIGGVHDKEWAACPKDAELLKLAGSPPTDQSPPQPQQPASGAIPAQDATGFSW